MDRWASMSGKSQGKNRKTKEIRKGKASEETKKRCSSKSGGSPVFQCFVVPEGRRLAKAAGAQPSGEMRNENLDVVVAPITCENQNVKSTSASEHFWKLRCSKVHGIVAPSAVGSKNVKNLPFSGNFWKLRCSKGASCCGAKHISK